MSLNEKKINESCLSQCLAHNKLSENASWGHYYYYYFNSSWLVLQKEGSLTSGVGHLWLRKLQVSSDSFDVLGHPEKSL